MYIHLRMLCIMDISVTLVIMISLKLCTVTLIMINKNCHNDFLILSQLSVFYHFVIFKLYSGIYWNRGTQTCIPWDSDPSLWCC